MENKTISFSTGNLTINDKFISFCQNNNNFIKSESTISRENIGHTDKQILKILHHSSLIYIFRIALFCVILGVVAILLGEKFFFIAKIAAYIFIIDCLVFLPLMYVDVLLGVSILKTILLTMFGVDCYKIVIHNAIDGNNLVFFIGKNEISKLPNFEDYKITKVHNVGKTYNEKDNFNDIQKLALLKEKGLISQQEFEKLKIEILGKFESNIDIPIENGNNSESSLEIIKNKNLNSDNNDNISFEENKKSNIKIYGVIILI